MAAEQTPNQHPAAAAQMEAQQSGPETRAWSPKVGERALRIALGMPHSVIETVGSSTQRPDKIPAARHQSEAA